MVVLSTLGLILGVPELKGGQTLPPWLKKVTEQPSLLDWLAGAQGVPILIHQAFLPEFPST